MRANPMQVIDRNGRPEPYRAWRDSARSIWRNCECLLQRLCRKKRLSLQHFDHEDLGMMGNILIEA